MKHVKLFEMIDKEREEKNKENLEMFTRMYNGNPLSKDNDFYVLNNFI